MFSAKPIAKVSSDSSWLSFDLLCNLTYMAALATSYASRDRIMEHAVKQAFKTGVYFNLVYLLAKRLGFVYTRAFQLVAKRAKAETVKGLLLRFASAIESGESESDFLTQEARVEREVYTAAYLRQLDSLQKWTDAYAALIVSATVIVVVVIVSTMLYDLGQSFVDVLAGTTVAITVFGSWVIFRSAPYEIKCYKERRGPLFRRLAVRMFLIGAPLAGLAVVYVLPRYGIGPAFVAVGALLLPSGVFAWLDDMATNKIDQEIPTFVRALARLTDALGTTVSVAAIRLDSRSTRSLEPHILRLQGRLRSHLNPALCWANFRDEMGSELANRSVRMLLDGCNLGGNPDRVGEIAGDFALNISLLRAKRQVASSTFAYLTFPLHAALAALMVFILEVMQSFEAKLSAMLEELNTGLPAGQGIALAGLPMFQQHDLGFVITVTIGIILGFTVVNALTPWFATGGHPIKIVSYASVMCILSGVSIILVPPATNAVLNH
ncbi:MAG: hypothetical protein HY672_01770 [Chloroflexi bacterium]|nr:hypothetical protein [Chloroflexota bacterium]